jgi:hypothetical protein
VNNTNLTFHNVKLWPVGFVDNLGCTPELIRSHDRTVDEFIPGQFEEITLEINPVTTIFRAAGVYKIGLVIVNDEHRHTLALKPVEVIP